MTPTNHGPVDARVAEAIEQALSASPAEVADREQRLWREVWGALPLSLDPVAPAARTWSRIQARLHGNDGNGEPAVVALSEPANDRGWTAAAGRWAAALIVGLLVTAAWLSNQVRTQDARIAELQQQMTLSAAGFAAPAAVPAVSAANIGFVATRSIESCRLKGQGDVEGARGWMYMGGEEPSCYLAVEGLQALADGQIYRAWFRSQGRSVPLGVVELDGDRGEMFAARVPSSVDAVFVTVESDGEPLTGPQGPTVLYGDAMIASL